MDQTLDFLSMNVIFMKILNIIFNLKMNIKKFCSCNRSAGCLTYDDHFFNELHFLSGSVFHELKTAVVKNVFILIIYPKLIFILKQINLWN